MPKIPFSPSASLRRGRLFAGVLLLNALLLFPLLYQTYKQYDARTAAWDVEAFMAIAEKGPADLILPFRFRILTSVLVREMRDLPVYDIEVAFTADPAAKRDFFHFVALNGLFTILTSGLIFLYLLGKVRPGFAWAGSLMYLFSFFGVVCGLIPMADASSHLAIIAGILCLERRWFAGFALACLVGAFAKETALIILVCWVLAHSLREWRNLVGLLWTLPALLVYLAAYRLFPGPLYYTYYQPTYMLDHMLAVFRPGAYDRAFFVNMFLSQLPLLGAALAWLCLKTKRNASVPALDPGLLLFPLLFWMSLTLGLGANSGRFVFMAFPAFMLFQARMLEALWDRWSGEAESGSGGKARLSQAAS